MAIALAIWEPVSVMRAGKDPIVLARLEHQTVKTEFGIVLLEFVNAMLDTRESIVIRRNVLTDVLPMVEHVTLLLESVHAPSPNLDQLASATFLNLLPAKMEELKTAHLEFATALPVGKEMIAAAPLALR